MLGLTTQLICWVRIAPCSTLSLGAFIKIQVIACWLPGMEPDLGVINTFQFSLAISFALNWTPALYICEFYGGCILMGHQVIFVCNISSLRQKTNNWE